MPAMLHCHTEYSTRDSLIRVDDLPVLAKAKGWDACAITDHGGVEGVPDFLKACKKENVKPIVGCEIYCAVPDTYHFAEKYHKEDKLHHLTILTKSAKGFSSLLKLISDGHRLFYDARRQKAAVPLKLVYDQLEDCVILSGCFSSPFWRGTDAAMDDLALFVDKFGHDFYFEVQPHHDWDGQIELNKNIVAVAETMGIPMVVTPDCHYGESNEHTFHEALLAVSDRKSMKDSKWKFSTKGCFVKTPQEVLNDLAGAGLTVEAARKALEATDAISERITSWAWDDLPKSTFPIIAGDLRTLCYQGLEAHGLSGRIEYKDRLDQELDTFIKAGAGIDRYLLLVRHCINLFKAEGAEIGPRGSVGGSLAAYCLGITPLDPIFHGLSWQRFYAPGRTNMPDADIDVDEKFRLKVPEILRREFGEANVAQISNYSEFGMRMSIKDAARAYGVKLFDKTRFQDDDKDAVKNKDLLAISPGKELATRSADAFQFAKHLVGRVRQYGAHAGGFVISASPLTSGRAAIVSRGKDKALCWDMRIAEELGFIKMDFLGVDSLSAIRAVGEAIDVTWKDVPLDDPKVMEDFSEGRTAGVPQFLTTGLRSFISKLKPKKFADIVWANAAFRPGGLGQMGPDELARKYNESPEEIFVYQEEVMDLCVKLAGFTWMEADNVRKVIAKSKGAAELVKFKVRFVDGCKRTSGWTSEDAGAFWDTLSEFGRYSFNKSHAVAYSWNSLRIAWAKRHHPSQTFAALLNSDSDSTEDLIREAPYYGVDIRVPDANHSGLDWTIEGDKIIRTPLTAIESIDLRVAKIIMGHRRGSPFIDRDDFKRRLSIESIRKIDDVVLELYSGKMPGRTFKLPVIEMDKIPTKDEIKELALEEKTCIKCDLRASCKKVVPFEVGRTNVMIVGEAPGKDENWRGRPFVGASGRLMDELFMERNINGKDITWSNVSHCKPPYIPEGQDKGPIEEMMMACPWVDKEIDLMKPPLILVLGKKAWQKFGGRGKSILKANATVMEKNGTKIVISVHPSFVLHDESRRGDIEKAVNEFAKLYHDLVPPVLSPEPRLPEEKVASYQDRAKGYFSRS